MGSICGEQKCGRGMIAENRENTSEKAKNKAQLLLIDRAVKGVSKKQLLEIIQQQAAQLEARDKQIEALQNENALLRQKMDLLIRKVFGPSSEKLDPAQLELFLKGEDWPGKPAASSALEEADPSTDSSSHVPIGSTAA